MKEKEFVIKVSENELKGIVMALSFRPFREVAGIILKLEHQVQEQLKSVDEGSA